MAIWVFLLILINAYFVVCEIILISVRKTKILEMIKTGRKRAYLVRYAHKHLKIFLTTIQVGVTISSIALGLIGAPWMEKFLESILPGFIKQAEYFPQLIGPLSLISFLILTYLQLVFGELLPKTLSLRKPEKYSIWFIPPLFIFVALFWPLSWLVNITTYRIIALLGIKKVFTERPYSEHEIKIILNESGKTGEITTTEMEMAYSVFKLKKIKLNQIMIPKKSLVAFENSETIKQVKLKIDQMKTTFNRYPVYRNDLDNIIGFFHISDLFRADLAKKNNSTLTKSKIIKKILYIDEHETAEKLIIKMRQRKIYSAVVIDNNQITKGIVGLTDIVDQMIKNPKKN